MDDIDDAILSHLRSDARQSMLVLGERVGLSSSAAHRRVKALEASGAIRAYRAEIDPGITGRSFEVFVSVHLARTDPATVAEFERAIAMVDEVVSCHRLFGEPDYSVLVAVRDVDAYERLWAETLSSLPGTARVSSQMTMKVITRR